MNVLFDGSQDSNDSLQSKEENCSGFKIVNKKMDEQCKEKTDELLWVTYKNEKKYFCKANHMIRFITKMSWSSEGEKSS